MKLASIFTDCAVVQREMYVPVWGKCSPGVEVCAELGHAAGHCRANTDGEFMLRLAPQPAGGPYELKVCAGDERVVLHDIMIGEVWLASGQSNMEYLLGTDWALPAKGREELLARTNARQMMEFLDGICDDDAIRWFSVPRVISGVSESNVAATWQRMDRKNASVFSAVALWYGRFLHEKLGVTIGLVNSSWGGTKVEPWTSRAGLLSNPDTAPMVHELDRAKAGSDFWTIEQRHREFLAQVTTPDGENKGVKQGWAKTDFDDSQWNPMFVPGSWIAQKIANNGAIWLRKKVEIPAAWAGRALKLNLGGVDKQDISYFNGVEVGRTGSGIEACYWDTPRHYDVPAALVQAGCAVIAVRAYSFIYDGSLKGSIHMYTLECPELNDSIDISGTWGAHVEYDSGLISPCMNDIQMPATDDPNTPEILFDCMIRPLIPYAIRGAIWYQGESNANLGAAESRLYRGKLGSLIRDWRTRWEQGDFPFLQVLLASYAWGNDASWAFLRERQMQVCEDLPEVYVANLVDCGEPLDIHPQDKKSVGERLARIALAQVYHENNVAAFGPHAVRFHWETCGVRVEFEHADGLYFKDSLVRGFEIAGRDGKFVPTEQVTIEGTSVVIASKNVIHPCAVRYAWADAPECSLYNQAGLPAYPFRS